MTRSLVAGGAGFLGLNLVRRLLDESHEVVVVDNLSSPSPVGLPSEVAFINVSVVDLPDLDGTFDYVFNLASPASPPRYLLDPIGTLRTGAEGTRKLLDLAARDDAVFVFTSTSEIYGDPLEHPQSETYYGNVDITSPRSCYDEAKRYAETLVHTYRRTGVVSEVRIARVFNTYGPGMAPDDGRVVTNFISQALAGEPLTLYGDGNQTRSFCYVDDLIEGLFRLAMSGYTDPVNLGNPVELTMAELADTVTGLLGETGRTYQPLPQSDPARRRPDITVAERELGWKPTWTLADGLPPTIDYLRDLSSVGAAIEPARGR